MVTEHGKRGTTGYVGIGIVCPWCGSDDMCCGVDRLCVSCGHTVDVPIDDQRRSGSSPRCADDVRCEIAALEGFRSKGGVDGLGGRDLTEIELEALYAELDALEDEPLTAVLVEMDAEQRAARR